MYIVVIAWAYVALMAAVVEAASANGSLLGAVLTLLMWGVLPLSIVVYLMRAPGRRRARRAAEHAAMSAPAEAITRPQPDGGDHPAGDAVAAVREEP
jgi:hypothetical protein